MKKIFRKRSLAWIALLVATGFWLWLREAQPGEVIQLNPDAVTESISQSESNSAPAQLLAPVASDVAPNSPAIGMSAAAHPLFAYVQPAAAAALDQALPAPTRSIHYVRLNATLFSAKDSPFWQPPGIGRVAIPLPSGATLEVLIDGTQSLGADRFTSTGTIEGRPQSRVIFSYNAGLLHASIQDAELGKFALRVATAELAQFYEIDESLVPPCGLINPPRPVLDADAIATLAQRKLAAAQIEPTVSTEAGPIPPMAPTAGANLKGGLLFFFNPPLIGNLSGGARTPALQECFRKIPPQGKTPSAPPLGGAPGRGG